MFDSDGEGRQVEGFDASDTYTTPEFHNRWLSQWLVEYVFGYEDSRSLHEFNKLVGPIRVFDWRWFG